MSPSSENGSSTQQDDLAFEAPQRPQYSARIQDMPAEERPRERLRDYGPSALANAELLAIILRTGTSKESALALAARLLREYEGLGGLARQTFSDLLREHGLGEAKAAELVATFTLAQRINALQPEDRPYLRSPADVMALLGGELSYLDQEHMRVLLVNVRNQLIAIDKPYKGSVNMAQVRIAELMREAIRRNAPCVILVHNHPSGDPSPSPDDVVLTKMAVQAGELMQVEVLDHIIIGERRFASMKQLGLGFGA
jgi:DNA repair protein RadC